MTKDERQQLEMIRRRLVNLADTAPATVMYVKGASAGSVAARIRAEAEALAAVLAGGVDVEQEQDGK